MAVHSGSTGVLSLWNRDKAWIWTWTWTWTWTWIFHLYNNQIFPLYNIPIFHLYTNQIFPLYKIQKFCLCGTETVSVWNRHSVCVGHTVSLCGTHTVQVGGRAVRGQPQPHTGASQSPHTHPKLLSRSCGGIIFRHLLSLQTPFVAFASFV